jgi:hypothetical protein
MGYAQLTPVMWTLYSPSLSSTTRLTGKSNHGIAEALVVTEAAVETHVTAIFHKLELGRAPTEHRRVLAVLTYLRGRPAPSDAHDAWVASPRGHVEAGAAAAHPGRGVDPLAGH